VGKTSEPSLHANSYLTERVQTQIMWRSSTVQLYSCTLLCLLTGVLIQVRHKNGRLLEPPRDGK
jgi:hypothetical protein